MNSLMDKLKFRFKKWKEWKEPILGNSGYLTESKFTFDEAYDWYKRNFKKEEAIGWRKRTREHKFGLECSAIMASHARMFGLTPEEAMDRIGKYLAGIMAKPMAVHLDYKGVMRTTTEAPTGLATADVIPVFDADLDTKED